MQVLVALEGDRSLQFLVLHLLLESRVVLLQVKHPHLQLLVVRLHLPLLVLHPLVLFPQSLDLRALPLHDLLILMVAVRMLRRPPLLFLRLQRHLLPQQGVDLTLLLQLHADALNLVLNVLQLLLQNSLLLISLLQLCEHLEVLLRQLLDLFLV